MKQLTQEELDTIKKCLKGHKYVVRYIKDKEERKDYGVSRGEEVVWIDQYDVTPNGKEKWYDSDRKWMFDILDILVPDIYHSMELVYFIKKKDCKELERFASAVGIYGEDAEPREVKFDE